MGIRSRRDVLLLIGFLLLVWVVIQQLGQYNEIRRERRVQLATNELLKAVAQNDIPRLNRAIQSGAMLNTPTQLGFTPLHHAVRNNNRPVIDSLISAGAMLDALSLKGTPLSVAVEGDDLELVRYLLDLGSDPNLGRPYPMEVAINRGQLPMLELLLDRGSRLEALQPTGNARGDSSWCLYWAVTSPAQREVKLEMLRFLLSKGAGPASSVLPYAIADSDAELGAILHGFGSPFTAREAVAFGDINHVRTMIEVDRSLLAQVVEDCDRGSTSYHVHASTLLAMALRRGHREIAEMLIDRGAPLHVLVKSEETLLHMAAAGGDAALVRRMIELGLDVNQATPQGITALHYAAAKNHDEAAKELIVAGADINREDVWQETPLERAVASKSQLVADLLISAGAIAQGTEKVVDN